MTVDAVRAANERTQPLGLELGDLSIVEEALADGQTLPVTWYTRDTIFRLERERIFGRSWQYVGHTGWAREAGDYFTGRAGHVPIVVARDATGALRAFVNVCRHRGHEVASGTGNRRTLQCPYHGWTYDLDGSLRAAPRAERERAFDPATCGLVPVAVDTWGPLIFVNPDRFADPLSTTLGNPPADDRPTRSAHRRLHVP